MDQRTGLGHRRLRLPRELREQGHAEGISRKDIGGVERVTRGGIVSSPEKEDTTYTVRDVCGGPRVNRARTRTTRRKHWDNGSTLTPPVSELCTRRAALTRSSLDTELGSLCAVVTHQYSWHTLYHTRNYQVCPINYRFMGLRSYRAYAALLRCSSVIGTT